MSVLASLALAAAVSAEPAPPAVVFSFEGLENRGYVMVALYADEASYKARGAGFRQARLPVREGRARATFDGLPPGRYAAMAFHDLNGDGKMNFRLGVPQEPYGASNDARSLPVPGWGAASFEVRAGAVVRQTMRLRKLF